MFRRLEVQVLLRIQPFFDLRLASPDRTKLSFRRTTQNTSTNCHTNGINVNNFGTRQSHTPQFNFDERDTFEFFAGALMGFAFLTMLYWTWNVSVIG